MGLFGWLRGKSDNGEVRTWREAWSHAVGSLDEGAIASLETALRRQPPIADDIEIEEEMLEGLRQLLEVERELHAARLPVVETTHRVVGADCCHFSAPVSVPDDPAQPHARSSPVAQRRRRCRGTACVTWCRPGATSSSCRDAPPTATASGFAATRTRKRSAAPRSRGT
jgi:hypothetical protein